MTILFLSRLFYPHIGGVEKHVLEVGKRLVKKGHGVIVITEKYQSNGLSAKATGEIDGIEIYRINAGRENFFKKFRIWWELWKNRRLIKGADIVHCHDVFFWYLPFRFLYPKKPIFTTFHGYEGNNLPTKKAILMHKLAEKMSTGNICVGDFLKKWYGTKPDFVTYGGVNIGKIRNPKSETNSKFRILFIGRLEKETGIVEYVKALKILKDKGYNLHLDVLGDGLQKEEVEKFCNKFRLNVKFYGFVNEVNNFLIKSNWVFVSRYLGILETMIARKLVFSVYNNDIKRDYLEMSPFAEFVVTANSAKEIYSKVVYYFKNPNEEKKVIDKAYEWSKSQTWDKMSEMYIKLWYKGEY